MSINLTSSISAGITTSISELKKNPMGIMTSAEGFPVAVLNRNRPVFYAVPAELYEEMLEKIDDMKLAELVEARANEPTVRVSIDEL